MVLILQQGWAAEFLCSYEVTSLPVYCKTPLPTPTWPAASKHVPTPIPLHKAPHRTLLRGNHLSPNHSLLSDSHLSPSSCSPSPFPSVHSPAGDGQQLASILSGINCRRNYWQIGIGILGWVVLLVGQGSLLPQWPPKSRINPMESQLKTGAKRVMSQNCNQGARYKGRVALMRRLPTP